MSAKRPEPAPFELDAATARILPEPDPEPLALAREPETAASTPPPPSRLPWVLGFGLLGLLLVQAALFVEELVRARPIMGGVFALLLALVSASAALLALRSWRAVRRLHGRARHRARAARLIASELPREAAALLAEVARELPPTPQTTANLARYRAYAHDALADRERIVLFERSVLAPLDRQAYRCIFTSARDVGLLTALSPVGLLDGLFVAWRSLELIKTLARLYGVTPSPLVVLALVRSGLRNVALAGLAELASEAALEQAGASLLSALSLRAGQGAGNAILLARLGLEAMRALRPLPFTAEKPPSLAQLRKALAEPPRAE